MRDGAVGEHVDPLVGAAPELGAKERTFGAEGAVREKRKGLAADHEDERQEDEFEVMCIEAEELGVR
eukprot:CAMPEP_0174893510 /NCGR_PEP_ID=MMETSP0167-20121228/8333_2 /TAXON_ID=38298 /ORGANISM="Rhodella maculata, Strain CCMP736" /LENGTH=66 /DNA_ID=CAMNT_0016132333 /DNA_START=688 /DNA_END=888 /DNA_ORIENTATION=-